MEEPARAVTNDGISQLKITDVCSLKLTPVADEGIIESSSPSSTAPAHKLDTLEAERQLIQLVRQESALYNSRHRRFNDGTFKEQLWQKIAQQLSWDQTECKSMWASVRYKYQRHVRRLRSYRQKMQSSRSQMRHPRPRPIMVHEEDLSFLHPHVAQQPLQRVQPKMLDDDVSIVPMPPTAIIDLDADCCDHYKVTAYQQRLIEAVRAYPDLYQTNHVNYGNHRHRGLIWGAISNELKEKATKLMKVWLLLQTRFEWELMQVGNGTSPLMTQLSFLTPHIRNTPGTVCKSSLYLQKAWFDPIENFRIVMNLINVLKTMLELGQMVDEFQDKDYKPEVYHGLWQRIATQVHSSHQCCEVTWLMLRNFYLELAEMRIVGYQLHDKWYFENIIGCIYKLLPTHIGRRANKRNAISDITSAPPIKVAKNKTPPSQNRQLSSKPRLPVSLPKATAKAKAKASAHTPPLPLAIVYPTDKLPALGCNIFVTLATTTTTTTTPNTTPNTSSSSSSNGSSSSSSSGSSSSGSSSSNNISRSSTVTTDHFVMPRITSAVSMSPQAAAAVAPPGVTSNASILQLQIPATVQRLPLAPLAPLIFSASGVTIRPVRPATAGTITVSLMPAASPIVTSMQGNLSGSSTSSTIQMPPLVPPLPKLVPISARKDSVLKPQKNNMRMPSSTPPATSATITRSPPVLYRQPKVRNEMSTPLPRTYSADAAPTPQDIKVDLFESPHFGRVLYAVGKGLTMPLMMVTSRTAYFIREVLSAPQLHCNNPLLAAKAADIWMQISKRFNMPEHVCRALWMFLSQNMNLFPKIKPMAELMALFKTTMKVWEKSNRLFSKFDEIARKYNWLVHSKKLPALMQLFEKYDHLYWEMRRPRPGEPSNTMRPPRQCSEVERQKVWKVARKHFPKMNHRDIWSMFKFAFKTYMEDLERGIENPWPQNWWRSLEKLRFLVNARYHPLEPYYYIVHNKFMEEVGRCTMYEMLMQPPAAQAKTIRPTATETMPWETKEAQQMLIGEIKKIAHFSGDGMQEQHMDQQQQPSQQQPSQQQPSQQQPQHQQPQQQQLQLLLQQQPQVEQVQQQQSPKKQRRTKQQLATQKRQQQTAQVRLQLLAQQEKDKDLPMTRSHRRTFVPAKQLPKLDAYQLTRLLRCHPKTYDNSSAVERRVAWQHVAKQLNAKVTDCRFTLQHALREMRRLKISDINYRCILSQKYYYHTNEMYNEMKDGKKSLVRTPQQCTDILLEPKDSVYPERYLPEINMITCKPRLVVKNWVYAINNLPVSGQNGLEMPLRRIFAAYAAMVKGKLQPSLQDQPPPSQDPPLQDLQQVPKLESNN